MPPNPSASKTRNTRRWWPIIATFVVAAGGLGIWGLRYKPSDSVTLIHSPASTPGGAAITWMEMAMQARTVALFVEDGVHTQGKPAFLRTLDSDGISPLREAVWSKDRTLVAIFDKSQDTPALAPKTNVAYDFKTHRFLQTLPEELWRSRGGSGPLANDGQFQTPPFWRVGQFEFPFEDFR